MDMISLACERMEPPFFMILVLDTTQSPKVDKCTNSKKRKGKKNPTMQKSGISCFLKEIINISLMGIFWKKKRKKSLNLQPFFFGFPSKFHYKCQISHLKKEEKRLLLIQHQETFVKLWAFIRILLGWDIACKC